MRPGRKLTESNAWREIARRIAEGEWLRFGLCCEVSNLGTRESGRISEATEERMKARITEYIGDGGIYMNGGGPWAFTMGAADERVLAALFLALEAEEAA